MKINLGGKKFGRLLVISEAGRNHDSRVLWNCLCDCGKTKIVLSSHLLRGAIRSCNCLRDETVRRARTHGYSRTPIYEIWCGMIKRCRNPKTQFYPYYGGRGIKVCERWDRFENFLEDMGQRPSPLHSIDRKDVNGNYEPGNCEWSTATKQARNTRKRKDGKNIVVGVSWHKATNKYMAYIAVNGKPFYLGIYQSIEEAAEVRRQAEITYWGKEAACTK